MPGCGVWGFRGAGRCRLSALGFVVGICMLVAVTASGALPDNDRASSVVAVVRADDPAPMRIVAVESAAVEQDTPPSKADWRRTPLPDRWNDTRQGHAGTVWYRFTVAVAHAPERSLALLLPRVSMNADLWVNDVLMGRQGHMNEPLTRHWNTPLLFPTPTTAWHEGENVVHVRVKAGLLHAGGLAAPWLGPTEVLADFHRTRKFWQNTVVEVLNVFVVSLGLFFLFIWLRKREHMHYGYFAVGAMLLGMAHTNMTVTAPPMPDAMWEWAIHVLTVWSLLLLGLFGLRYAGRRMPRVEAGVLAYAGVVTLIQMAMNERGWASTIIALLLPVLAIGGWALLLMMRRILAQPRRDHLLFAPAAIVTLLTGVHDWMLKAGHLPFEQVYLLPFVAPVLLSSLAWIIAGEFAAAQRDLASLNQDLAGRVQLREAQLRDSLARIAEIDRAYAVATERARILRDMHDGVGAHLTTAMRQLANGRSTSDEVMLTLRDSLDQLKLSIDAMNLPFGDVNALLASLRYRLQPRMESTGLRLVWAVGVLPTWQGGTDDGMRHLQFLLFEVLSNVLQHAHAETLTLSAGTEGDTIVIALRDDGRGCSGPPGNGMRSMRDRAALLSATLVIDSGPDGTCVTLRLPTRRRDESPAPDGPAMPL